MNRAFARLVHEGRLRDEQKLKKQKIDDAQKSFQADFDKFTSQLDHREIKTENTSNITPISTLDSGLNHAQQSTLTNPDRTRQISQTGAPQIPLSNADSMLSYEDLKLPYREVLLLEAKLDTSIDKEDSEQWSKWWKSLCKVYLKEDLYTKVLSRTKDNQEALDKHKVNILLSVAGKRLGRACPTQNELRISLAEQLYQKRKYLQRKEQTKKGK